MSIIVLFAGLGMGMPTSVAESRAMLNVLNSESPVKTKITVSSPQNCKVIDNFGSFYSQYQTRTEVLRALNLKAPANWSPESLKSLNEQFLATTSNFKSNFADTSSKSMNEVRGHLLALVGYNEKSLDRASLEKLAGEDARWKLALQKLSCNLNSCSSFLSASINFDKLLPSKDFKSNLENTLVEQMSEALSVDEMLYAQVIPNERARTRLLSALFTLLEVEHQTAWACQKSNAGINLISHIEVQSQKYSWASDARALSQKSNQICLSSLVKLIELCDATKGAFL